MYTVKKITEKDIGKLIIRRHGEKGEEIIEVFESALEFWEIEKQRSKGNPEWCKEIDHVIKKLKEKERRERKEKERK